MIAALGWLSLASAIGAIAVYGLMVTRGPRVRLFNGLGLFLTGMALFQAPTMLAQAAGVNVVTAILLLNIAVVAQAAAVLRNRASWDGVDRRHAPGGASQ